MLWQNFHLVLIPHKAYILPFKQGYLCHNRYLQTASIVIEHIHCGFQEASSVKMRRIPQIGGTQIIKRVGRMLPFFGRVESGVSGPSENRKNCIIISLFTNLKVTSNAINELDREKCSLKDPNTYKITGSWFEILTEQWPQILRVLGNSFDENLNISRVPHHKNSKFYGCQAPVVPKLNAKSIS